MRQVLFAARASAQVRVCALCVRCVRACMCVRACVCWRESVFACVLLVRALDAVDAPVVASAQHAERVEMEEKRRESERESARKSERERARKSERENEKEREGARRSEKRERARRERARARVGEPPGAEDGPEVLDQRGHHAVGRHRVGHDVALRLRLPPQQVWRELPGSAV